jgi:class 3 adenylate cyclase/tetratricopeptide (TPR) repeat protein
VLFADLAGSTELAVRHDPEQLRALLSAFFEEMAQHVHAYGGTVEKYAGDSIMAVFGVPATHEDDAERAVRAAFAMRHGLAQLNPVFEQEYGVHLALRVGIATGEAVAASDEASEFLVTGEVANLAARLQSEIGGIVVSQDTHRLVGPFVESERLTSLVLKGFPQPVTAYRVTGLRSGGTPRGVPGLTSPVVGREPELSRLQQCVEELRRGRGQVVSLVGEAGLGKSRLKIELRDHLPEGVRWLEGRCQAYLQTTSYAPFIQVLRALLQLGGGEPEAVARTKLRAGLRGLVGEGHAQVQPAVGHLLGIPVETTASGLAPGDPRALQSELLLVVRAIIEGLAKRAPVILAVEDLHWVDAGSMELLTLLMELTDFAPVMLLVTSRPEVEGRAWDVRFHAQRNFPHRLTEIPLAPLTPEHAERLVGNLLHVSELPEPLRVQILERAEGNPFFVEEIIRGLIEQRVLRRDGERWVADTDPGRLAIPGTLRGVIAARIDRLPAEAKRVLQQAAVVGRFFGYGALQALGGRDDLDRALAQLLRAELIREWARLPEPEYLFKHALTQEAAYASILGESRRGLHHRLATHLEETASAIVDEQPAFLAHHWLLAEKWGEALRYTLEAATRAQKLYARSEAIGHLWQALDLLDRLPRTAERDRTHVQVVLALLRLPGWMRGEAGLREGRRHLDEAIREAGEDGDPASLADLESMKGLLLEDEELLKRSLARAEESGDAPTMASTTQRYAEYLGRHGRYEEALVYVPRAVEILKARGDQFGLATWMGYTGRCYSSRAGKLSEAFRYAAGAREAATAAGDRRLKAWRAMEAEPYLYEGGWEEVVRAAEEGLPTSWEIGEWAAILFPSAWLGIAYAKLGRLADARRVIGRALTEGQARTVSPYSVTYLHIALAQLHLAEGEPEDALAVAQKARELADRSGFRLEIGAAHRVLGEAHEHLGHTEEADRAFQDSVAILEEIQSRPELGQTLLAYGRFLARTDPTGGRFLVERALRLFEEMGATGWAEEARRALVG